MDNLTLLINVRAGQCQWTGRDVETIQGYVARFEGRQVQILFRAPRRDRTIGQNRYYWGVVLSMIANHTGHDPEYCHEFFKDAYLPRAYVTIAAAERHVPKSTATITTQEFELYLERIRAFAAQELGLNIPLPNEV